MNKLIRRRARSKNCTPTLVNLAQGAQDGWVTLPAWEVEELAGTGVYFQRGPDVYATWRRTIGEGILLWVDAADKQWRPI